MAWMAENEVSTMIEESEDILDGLESMLAEEGSGVTEEVLIDATEIITAIIVAGEMKTQGIAPLFQKAGKLTTGRIRKTDRAEGMVKIREEMRKLKNQRLRPAKSMIRDTDFDDTQVRVVRRAESSRRMDKGGSK